MKRRIQIILLAFIFSLIFFGCRKKSEDILLVSGRNNEVQFASTSDNMSIHSTIEDNETDNNKKNYGKIGVAIRDQELKHILKNSLDRIDCVKLFGEPDKKTQPEVWGIDGLERQTWYYESKGIELQFIKDTEYNSNISYVYIISPCTLKTIRGIGIGNTKEELLKAYSREIDSEEVNNDPSKVIVGTIYGGIIFTLTDNKVTSIFIGSAAE